MGAAISVAAFSLSKKDAEASGDTSAGAARDDWGARDNASTSEAAIAWKSDSFIALVSADDGDCGSPETEPVFGTTGTRRSPGRAASSRSVFPCRKRSSMPTSPPVVKWCLPRLQQREDYLASLRILKQQLHQQRPAVTAAQRNLDIALTRYRTGVDTYLNVFTAQTNLLSNQQTVISLHIEQMTSSVELIEALGGGSDTTQLPSEKAVTKKNL